MEFLDLKYLLFSGIFLSGIGGYPPPPLTENHPALKPIAESGDTPLPPLTDNHPAQKPLAEKGGPSNRPPPPP